MTALGPAFLRVFRQHVDRRSAEFADIVIQGSLGPDRGGGDVRNATVFNE